MPKVHFGLLIFFRASDLFESTTLPKLPNNSVVAAVVFFNFSKSKEGINKCKVFQFLLFLKKGLHYDEEN